jgi:hypothetical protein
VLKKTDIQKKLSFLEQLLEKDTDIQDQFIVFSLYNQKPNLPALKDECKRTGLV